ncbi:MAG: tRNA 2-thiouridine(34) synthase MnmA [Treponema sp.]|nr:tRNA 2-thiouridine(34) synthase MnmA [Treponema sp.]
MEINLNKKALIAMSGGVDSSVAAFLMKQQGFDCIGITMKLFENADIGETGQRSCCSLLDASAALNTASSMDIPHYINDFTEDFRNYVMKRFADIYISGATPNPCIDCNKYIKFEKLKFRALQLGIDYIATGHYAQITYNEETGRYLLKKALDNGKDQSYVLYNMTQEQLANTIFPLGALTKLQVREIAKNNRFNNADKEESQDICFVPKGKYADFIERFTCTSFPCGDFIDLQGNILGRHKGIIRYTIGQRRGIDLSLNKPMYVHSKNLENNTVTLCEDKDLFNRSLKIRDFNLISLQEIRSPIRVKVKIRYNQNEQWATAIQTSESTVDIEFDEGQRAITKGQAAVLYDDDIVVGGGTIK